MEFVPIRSLRDAPRDVWGQLSQDGELVITNNGKPAALMIDLTGKDVFTVVTAFRQSLAGARPPVFPHSPFGGAGVKTVDESLAARQKTAVKEFIRNVNAADEPLDEEFDEILSHRVNITRALDL